MKDPRQELALAQLRLRQGQSAAAEAHLLEALALDESFLDGRRAYGRFLLEANRPVDALPHWQLVTGRSEAVAADFVGHVEALLATEQVDAALALLNDARARGLDGPALEEVAARLAEQASLLQETADAHVARARAAAAAAEFEAASAAYEAALAQWPRAAIHTEYAALLQRMGAAPAQVEAQLRGAVTLAPAAAQHLAYGQFLRRQWRLAEARRQFEAARAAAPDMPAPQLALAELALVTGAPDAPAVTRLQQVAAGDAAGAAQLLLARRARQVGEEEVLAALLPDLAAAPPEDDVERLLLVDLLLERDPAQAAAVLQTVDVSEDVPALLLLQMRLARRRREFDVALATLDRLQARLPTAPALAAARGAITTAAEQAAAVDRLLAQALFMVEDAAEKKTLFAAAVAQAPDYGYAHFEYGQFLAQEGDVAAARQLLARAVALEPAQREWVAALAALPAAAEHDPAAATGDGNFE